MLCKTHLYVGQKMSWIFMGRKVELEGRCTIRVVKVVVHHNKILCHEDTHHTLLESGSEWPKDQA